MLTLSLHLFRSLFPRYDVGTINRRNKRTMKVGVSFKEVDWLSYIPGKMSRLNTSTPFLRIYIE